MELRKQSYICTENRYCINWAALEPYTRGRKAPKLDKSSYSDLCDYVNYNPPTANLPLVSWAPGVHHQSYILPRSYATMSPPSPNCSRENAPSQRQSADVQSQTWRPQSHQAGPLPSRPYAYSAPQYYSREEPPPPSGESHTALIALATILVLGAASVAGIYGLVCLVKIVAEKARLGWEFLKSVFGRIRRPWFN